MIIKLRPKTIELIKESKRLGVPMGFNLDEYESQDEFVEKITKAIEDAKKKKK